MMLGLVGATGDAGYSRTNHGSGYSTNRNNDHSGLHSQGIHNIQAHISIHTHQREPHRGVPFFITTGGSTNAWRIQGQVTHIRMEVPHDIGDPVK